METEIKLEFLDVSCLHCYQEKVGDEFFDALGACKNIQIFEFKSIQALIDYKWPIAREYTIKMLFLPFLCYLSFFIAYSNAFNGQVEMTDSMLVGDKVISAFLYLFSIYFLQNECRQFLSSGLEYLASPWNLAFTLNTSIGLSLEHSARDMMVCASWGWPAKCHSERNTAACAGVNAIGSL